MAQLALNIKYVADPSIFTQVEDGMPKSITLAMQTLMIATGINRLLSFEDFSEFFTRLSICFKHYGLIETFFTNDHLFEYLLDETPCIAKVDDITSFIGVTFSDKPENLSFDIWLEKFDNFQSSAGWISAMLGIGLFYKETKVRPSDPDNPEKMTTIQYNPILSKITDTDIKNAKILSSTIMKELPSSLFTNWELRFPDAEDTLKQELARKESYLFNYEKLSSEVKQRIRDHFNFYWDNDDYDEGMAINLTHLAYLWTNGFVYYYDIGNENLMAEIDDYFPLNSELFPLEDGGVNLEETKDNYDLDSLFPILKIDTSN